MLALYLGQRAPQQVTFEGRNFDILVGVTAIPMATLVRTERAPAMLVRVWNVLGLVVLATTIAIVATSTPGPLHARWPGAPLTAIATFPTVWLAALLAPLAVFLHVASLQSRAVR